MHGRKLLFSSIVQNIRNIHCSSYEVFITMCEQVTCDISIDLNLLSVAAVVTRRSYLNKYFHANRTNFCISCNMIIGLENNR